MELLVTGASGLVGASTCRTALSRGHTVRALVRDSASQAVLEALGCQVLRGDLADLNSIEVALDGVSGVIHAAAVIGGTWTTASPEDFESVNYQGVANLLAAAAEHGNPRCVLLNTGAILDWSYTLTERSPTVGPMNGPTTYTSAKLAAYYLAMHNAARGQDVSVVIPGGIYGPSPVVTRALVPTSFNSCLLAGLRGQLTRYLDMPLMWAFVQDVVDVSLAAVEHGRTGARYLALGAPEDVCSLASLCNRMNELAGVEHRVRDVRPADAADEFGSMALYAERTYAEPLFDPSETTKELGVRPTYMARALEETLGWFREVGELT